MSYENGTASDIADLFSKLKTFATGTPGWNDSSLTPTTDRLGLDDGSTYVQFRWDTSTPANVGIYQSLGITSAATDPGNHTDDSGNGAISGTNSVLDDERHVALVDSSMLYWFFEDDSYIHVVAETNSTPPESYAHFGFGAITKVGDWTGGQYVYGWRKDPAGGSSDSAVRVLSSMLLDGAADSSAPGDMNGYVATLHIEGLPNQTASGKWAIVWGDIGSEGTDRGGTGRDTVQGGFRGGPVARPFARFSSNSEKGLSHFYPITLWYREGSNAYYLGEQPDVRGVNIEFFAPGDELVIGSDTWVIFPSHRKDSTGTRFQGIAYKKVVT